MQINYKKYKSRGIQIKLKMQTRIYLTVPWP